MKSKTIIAAVAAVVVILIGAGLLLKGSRPVKAPVKASSIAKAISKDMGGLIIQILDTKNKAMVVRGKVFRSIDSKSSIYVGPITSNKMQELAPGIYDIEIDTIPQRIYKGIGVSKGREKIESLGCMTGLFNVRMIDAKKKAASYPVKIYNPKNRSIVAAGPANRPLEVWAGTYDIEIGTVPKILETAVKIEAGKEKVLDLGAMTGIIIVKVFDENKVEKNQARQSVRIKKSDTNELVMPSTVNRPIEIRQGTYNVEIGTTPPQVKKDIKVNALEEMVLEVVIRAPGQK